MFYDKIILKFDFHFILNMLLTPPLAFPLLYFLSFPAPFLWIIFPYLFDFCNSFGWTLVLIAAFLDYNNIPYKIVEVNPISKKEIKWSDYKKVPILKVDGEQMVDSSGSLLFLNFLLTIFWWFHIFFSL